MDYPASNPDANLQNGKFTDGDPQNDIPPSTDLAEWANSVTDENLNLFKGAGLTPSETDLTQTLQAAIVHVATIADLRALPEPPVPSGKTVVVYVHGYSAYDDGGGGPFRWQGNSSQTDDGGSVIIPDSAPTSGRWLRLINGEVHVEYFGAVSGGTVAETSQIQAAIDYASGNKARRVYALGRNYLIDGTLLLPSKTILCGAGIGATDIKLADGSDTDMIQNSDQTNGNVHCGVENLTLNGNKSGQGVSGSQYRNLFFLEVDEPYLRNVESCFGAGQGVRVSSGGDKTIRDALLDNIRTHGNNDIGLVVMYAARGASYTHIYSYNNGTDGVRFDHSEGIANHVFAYANGSRGIEINNVFAFQPNNFQATRNGHEGIWVSQWVDSVGGNWVSKNNSQAVNNTYDDIYFDDTSGGYGPTDRVALLGVECGSSAVIESQYSITNRPRYGLYIEDGCNQQIMIDQVRVGSTVTGDIRLPPTNGSLKIFDLPAGTEHTRLRTGDMVILNGELETNNTVHPSGLQSIDDNQAISFSLIARGAIIAVSGLSGGTSGMVWVDVKAPNAAKLSGSGAAFSVTTGPLGGATGNDGDFTVSANSDGKVYFENRTGFPTSIAWAVLGSAGTK